jgi:hypothetical protein
MDRELHQSTQGNLRGVHALEHYFGTELYLALSGGSHSELLQ